MPRSTREWALRKLSASQNNIDWCIKHLAEVTTKYSDAHPKIADSLLNCVELSIILKQGIRKVREKI